MLSWLLLQAAGCSTTTPIVIGPAGLCWPAESDAAYAEWEARKAEMPATQVWRDQLGKLKAQLTLCQ